jgi:hypothetical protein
MSNASQALDVAAGAMLDRYDALFADPAMPRLPHENIISYVLRRAGNDDAAENGTISIPKQVSLCLVQQLANCSMLHIVMLLVDVMRSANTALLIRLAMTLMPMLRQRKSSVGSARAAARC